MFCQEQRRKLTMDDLISRQAILGKIRDYIEEYSDLEPNGEHNLKWCAMREAEEVVLTEPPAQAEQRTEKRTGHWFDVGSLSCRCSECGCKNNKESNYCPECGAYMKGENN